MIRVGPAGWSYPDWEGRIYPRSKPRGFHPLPILARTFQTVEINSTFYALPRSQHASRWAKLVEEHTDFRFIVKLHRSFSHEPPPDDLAVWERSAEAFRAGIAPLERRSRLSGLLVQFPSSFAFGPLQVRRLGRIRSLFRSVPLIVELRHRSWFEHEALDTVRGLSYSLAYIDLPPAWNHPPDWHPPTGPVGYVRLHGRNARHWFDAKAGRDDRYDYLYDSEELSGISARTRRVAAQHDETFVITNNHFSGKAVANAVELLFDLHGGRLPVPRRVGQRVPASGAADDRGRPARPVRGGIMTDTTLSSLNVGARSLRVRVERPEKGTGPWPVVVVLHGFKGFMHWGFFPELSRRIAERGWMCVSFNFSGSGVGEDLESFSEEEAFAKDTISLQLEDLDAVRAAIDAGQFAGADTTRVALFGHSRGGGVALLYASEHAELRSLVTWAAIDDVDRFDDATKELWRANGHIWIPNARTGQNLRLDLDALLDVEANRERLDIEAACTRSRVPTLLVHGTADPVVAYDGARRLSAAFAEGLARLEVHEGAGHTLGARHPLTDVPPELDLALEQSLAHFDAHWS